MAVRLNACRLCRNDASPPVHFEHTFVIGRHHFDKLDYARVPIFQQFRSRGRIRVPCVFFNQDGFYDDLLRLFQRMLDEKFFKPTNMGLFRVATTVPGIFAEIESAAGVKAEPKWFETR